MITKSFESQLDELFRDSRWEEARALIEREREKRPQDHWLITQVGVAFYEQKQYEKARELFVESLEIVDDCPLTLWNLAGALDALGETEDAITLYSWLLRSNKSSKDDPCWESQEWTDSLKTDCVYRLGRCFEHQKKMANAEYCYRQYLTLVTNGMTGTYPADNVVNKIRELGRLGRKRTTKKQLRDMFELTVAKTGIDVTELNGNRPPRFDRSATVIGPRNTNKR